MKISETNKKIIKRQWIVFRFPILIALVWAIVVCHNTEPSNRSLLNSVKDFGAALFLAMWIVGQFQRTSKEVRDNSNYSNLQTGIDDLRKAISKLQPIPTTTTTTTTTTSQPSTTQFLTNSMLQSANNAVGQGFVLAGLMQAGVAFEQAIVNKAQNLQIPREDRTTVAQLLNKLREYYSKDIIQELFAVWKLRNQLIHLTEEAAIELEKSPNLIKYFIWAINTLEDEKHGT